MEYKASESQDQFRMTASWISFAVSLGLLGVKFYAYWLTESKAVLSDALESIVNVLAAAVGIGVLMIASKPADKDHPYGHGKAEFFSAAFEGGLITFAAVIIAIEAISSFFRGFNIRELDTGLWIISGAGVVNAALGFFLQFVGKKHHSATLVASGKHVLSDFWTSFGVIVGLFLVRWTNWMWLDAATALVVSVVLARTGVQLVNQSIGALMDAEDRTVIEHLGLLFRKHVRPGIIRIHHTRVIRAGRHHHVDAHVVVPEFWDVKTTHAHTNDFEAAVFKDYPIGGDIAFHVDPCRRAYCRVCDLDQCHVRIQKFEERIPFSIEELVAPEEPLEFKTEIESTHQARHPLDHADES